MKFINKFNVFAYVCRDPLNIDRVYLQLSAFLQLRGFLFAHEGTKKALCECFSVFVGVWGC